MRITALLLGLLLMGGFPVLLHAQQTEQQPASTGADAVTINWGAKAGFTAALSLVSDFSIGGTPIKEVQNGYKVGSLASVFMRVNIGRHFLQPEVSYNVNHCDISFYKPQPEDLPLGSGINEEASISSKIRSFDVPVLYGYNFIKQGSYQMAVFAGPKLRLLLNRKSDIIFYNFDEDDLREELHRFSLSFTLGLSVAISPIFFDFRYDIGMLNLTKHLSSGDVNYRRRDNVLSFSLGIFF